MTDQPQPSGPHRRYDLLADAWVLVSPQRSERPWLGAEESPSPVAVPALDPGCHLCPGSLRATGERNPIYGSTFVFTNDFAALAPDTPGGAWTDGLLRTDSVRGTCRVVCYTPRHDRPMSTMTVPEIRGVIDVWADESEDLGRDHGWVQVFENRGEAMGASNPHPHGQIWATDTLPGIAVREAATQAAHHSTTGRSLLVDYAVQEAGGPRVVVETPDWLVVVPFWAVWPFETLVVPRRPAGRLADLDDARRDGLAATLADLLGRYDGLFGVPFPYSMGWHQAPYDDRPDDGWQLHAHLYPPLLRSATVRKFMVGYELLAEPQRDLLPEVAADRLRSAARRPPTAGTSEGSG